MARTQISLKSPSEQVTLVLFSSAVADMFEVFDVGAKFAKTFVDEDATNAVNTITRTYTPHSYKMRFLHDYMEEVHDYYSTLIGAKKYAVLTISRLN